jgi:rubrerythrin
MVTTVGTGTDAATVIRDLIQLENDAIAAYDAALLRLDRPEHKQQVEAFRADHERHLSELTAAAASEGADVPKDTDMKAMLTTGKVALADMAGESAVLKAMSSNETDTITAYDNASCNESVPASLRPMLERALADERRHKAWMDEAASAA